MEKKKKDDSYVLDLVKNLHPTFAVYPQVYTLEFLDDIVGTAWGTLYGSKEGRAKQLEWESAMTQIRKEHFWKTSLTELAPDFIDTLMTFAAPLTAGASTGVIAAKKMVKANKIRKQVMTLFKGTKAAKMMKNAKGVSEIVKAIKYGMKESTNLVKATNKVLKNDVMDIVRKAEKELGVDVVKKMLKGTESSGQIYSKLRKGMREAGVKSKTMNRILQGPTSAIIAKSSGRAGITGYGMTDKDQDAFDQILDVGKSMVVGGVVRRGTKGASEVVGDYFSRTSQRISKARVSGARSNMLQKLISSNRRVNVGDKMKDGTKLTREMVDEITEARASKTRTQGTKQRQIEHGKNLEEKGILTNEGDYNFETGKIDEVVDSAGKPLGRKQIFAKNLDKIQEKLRTANEKIITMLDGLSGSKQFGKKLTNSQMYEKAQKLANEIMKDVDGSKSPEAQALIKKMLKDIGKGSKKVVDETIEDVSGSGGLLRHMKKGKPYYTGGEKSNADLLKLMRSWYERIDFDVNDPDVDTKAIKLKIAKFFRDLVTENMPENTRGKFNDLNEQYSTNTNILKGIDSEVDKAAEGIFRMSGNEWRVTDQAFTWLQKHIELPAHEFAQKFKSKLDLIPTRGGTRKGVKRILNTSLAEGMEKGGTQLFTKSPISESNRKVRSERKYKKEEKEKSDYEDYQSTESDGEESGTYDPFKKKSGEEAEENTYDPFRKPSSQKRTYDDIMGVDREFTDRQNTQFDQGSKYATDQDFQGYDPQAPRTNASDSEMRGDQNVLDNSTIETPEGVRQHETDFDNTGGASGDYDMASENSYEDADLAGYDQASQFGQRSLENPTEGIMNTDLEQGEEQMQTPEKMTFQERIQMRKQEKQAEQDRILQEKIIGTPLPRNTEEFLANKEFAIAKINAQMPEQAEGWEQMLTYRPELLENHLISLQQFKPEMMAHDPYGRINGKVTDNVIKSQLRRKIWDDQDSTNVQKVQRLQKLNQLGMYDETEPLAGAGAEVGEKVEGDNEEMDTSMPDDSIKTNDSARNSKDYGKLGKLA